MSPSVTFSQRKRTTNFFNFSSLIFSNFQFILDLLPMGCRATCRQVLVCVTLCCTLVFVNAEDPYRFFTWNVTYGNIYPLGVRQQVCAIIFLCKSCNLTTLSLGWSEKRFLFLLFCVFCAGDSDKRTISRARYLFRHQQ